ncbi:nuclear transport factor 2 family protein [Amycolatopsis viridis]|uniref:Ketosteroid isomerase-like protein n=1 Tax=Amycolatopsis viridis TaxID=185678 RepID=A0ABX0SWA9_9PSEU|nr:nuclear transport factor 2 family protein [Amycolatopsis viridis]NIH80818.1 ketosteroid isomerase-like protein [Amycolatopsis viridis]
MSVADRLDRLESIEEIRRLVSTYALALDSRDVDRLVSLFVPDVRVAGGGTGREALAAWFGPVLRPYGVTFHLIGNHVIEFTDADHATGVVYCRPEHEVGDEWIVMPMQYWDRYERTPEGWRFRSRTVQPFYAADVRHGPNEAGGRFHFPGNPLVDSATLPEKWRSWQEFWAGGA